MIDVICWVGRWKDVAVSRFEMNEKCSCFLKTFFIRHIEIVLKFAV